MTSGFKGWSAVSEGLRQLVAKASARDGSADGEAWSLDEGQCRALGSLAVRIERHGVLVADEVGMGKTRIAVALIRTVIECGGRVAILIPPGLGYQWGDELRHGGVDCQPVIRSLRQYLSAWAPESIAGPWSRQRAVLISHAFTNWRLGERAAAWRWALLPELYAQWRKQGQDAGRFPRGYHAEGAERLSDDQVCRAAEDIVSRALKRRRGAAAKLLARLVEEAPWPGALDAGAYARDAALRPWLELAVGLGLGHFDLIVVDEAHKSRGDDAGLTRLLEGVILSERGGDASVAGRRLCLTATPVELDAGQWRQMLARIGVDPALTMPVVDAYSRAVKDVRARPTDVEARESFSKAARAFQSALGEYVLRRDKREAPSVRRFHELSGLPIHAYREEGQVTVRADGLPAHWRQALLAAEALSMMSADLTGTAAQRLRLTIGNGHGLNAVLDGCVASTRAQESRSAGEGGDDEFVELELEADAEEDSDAETTNATLARARWWLSILKGSFDRGDRASLYRHPAIQAAVEAIETCDRQGEKVLVFGRYTAPLRALVGLLNARALLRSLDDGRFWPQALLNEEEWSAMEAAHHQLSGEAHFDRPGVQDRLREQYERLETSRIRIRAKLDERLDEGFAGWLQQSRIVRLHAAFKRTRQGEATLARALRELLGDAADEAPSSAWADAFASMVDAASERDEGDEDGDGELDAEEADGLWSTLAERLTAEYGSPQGTFARLMNGDTPQSTRRLLQLAFNREQSFPRVLVAQSVVGREGLNLHRACRTVLLLHPEWNPGVVEQQIGRVDRVGSWWERQLEAAVAAGAAPQDLPRIRILPVVFEGTYDEQNWAVLRTRWDELRAQLHGIVIPVTMRSGDPALDRMFDEINQDAPRLTPTGT